MKRWHLPWLVGLCMAMVGLLSATSRVAGLASDGAAETDALPWCPESLAQQAAVPNAAPTPLPDLTDTRAVCQLRSTIYQLTPGQLPSGASLPPRLGNPSIPTIAAASARPSTE